MPSCPVPERTLLIYNRECISEYIPDGVCAVGRYCVLNECPVALFAGSVVSVRVGFDS